MKLLSYEDKIKLFKELRKNYYKVDIYWIDDNDNECILRSYIVVNYEDFVNIFINDEKNYKVEELNRFDRDCEDYFSSPPLFSYVPLNKIIKKKFPLIKEEQITPQFIKKLYDLYNFSMIFPRIINGYIRGWSRDINLEIRVITLLEEHHISLEAFKKMNK